MELKDYSFFIGSLFVACSWGIECRVWKNECSLETVYQLWIMFTSNMYIHGVLD